MNPATALPPQIRAYIYWVTFAAGIGIGALQIAFGNPEPHWLDIAARVLPFVAGGFGVVAASHTDTSGARRANLDPPVAPVAAAPVINVNVDAQALADRVAEHLTRDARGRFTVKTPAS